MSTVGAPNETVGISNETAGISDEAVGPPSTPATPGGVMRRVRYESAGGPLFLEDAPVPEPGPGEVLVRCEAIGVTLPVVRKVTEAAEPIPLGGEIAGEIVSIGDSVTRFRT